jgi:hypothetical protein
MLVGSGFHTSHPSLVSKEKSMLEFIVRFFVVPLIMGILLSVPGVLFERWLVTRGIVRDNTRSVFVVVFCTVYIKQIWFETISWWYFIPFILLSVTLGVNRADLWTTSKKGKWWWKSDK